MKKTVRFTSLLCSAAMLLSMTACNSSGGAQANESKPSSVQSQDGASSAVSTKLTDTPVTYSFLRPENALQPYKEGCATVTEIEKRTGIKLDVMIVPGADWSTKMNTLMAANQMPDFFRMWTDVKEVVGSGALLELDELIEQNAPTIKNLYNTIPNLDKATVNGKIYGLPTIRMDENYEKGSTPNIRVDLLKENGLEIPKTWDELYTALSLFKTKYPSSIPWGSRGEYNLARSYTSCIKSLGAEYNLYQDDSGIWKLGRMEQSYKEALTFLNKCYKEGIIDNEYIITSAQDWKSGLANGKYLFYYDNPTFINSFNTSLKEVNADARIEPIPILANSQGKRQSYGYANHTFNEYGFNADIKNPELAIKLFDWLYGEEGSLLMNYGIEGKDYDMVSGVPTFKAEVVEKYRNESADPLYAASSDLGIGLLFFTPGWYSNYGDAFMTANENDVTPQYIHNVYKDEMDTILLQPVQPPYTDTESEQIKKINQNIEDYSMTEVNKFITGERSLTEFDAFVSYLKSNGAEDLEKIANEAQARYEASK